MGGGSLNLVKGSKKTKQRRGGVCVGNSYHYSIPLGSALNNIYMVVVLKTLENQGGTANFPK